MAGAIPTFDIQCGYCGQACHTNAVCRKKQRDKKVRCGESIGFGVACSIFASEQKALTLFCHLNAVTSLPSIITAQAFGTPPVPLLVSLMLNRNGYSASAQNQHFTLEYSRVS